MYIDFGNVSVRLAKFERSFHQMFLIFRNAIMSRRNFLFCNRGSTNLRTIHAVAPTLNVNQTLFVVPRKTFGQWRFTVLRVLVAC